MCRMCQVPFSLTSVPDTPRPLIVFHRTQMLRAILGVSLDRPSYDLLPRYSFHILNPCHGPKLSRLMRLANDTIGLCVLHTLGQSSREIAIYSSISSSEAISKDSFLKQRGGPSAVVPLCLSVRE